MQQPPLHGPPQTWWRAGDHAIARTLHALADENDEETDLFWSLFDFYNDLLWSSSQGDPNAFRRALLSSNLFRDREMPGFDAMFSEAVARMAFGTGRMGDAVTALERMAVQAGPNQLSDVVDLAKDVGLALPETDLDLRPRLIAALARVHERLGDPVSAARVLLKVAAYYSHAGATIPASRALEAAMAAAARADNPRLAAEVFGEVVVVAFEARDAAVALLATDKAIAIWSDLKSHPPTQLLANRATVLMQLGQVERAAKLYVTLLQSGTTEMQGAMKMNLASCRRRLGDLDAATTLLAEARDCLERTAIDENHLELELIAAKLASDTKDPDALASALLAACQIINLGLANVARLHHRRGYRARFVSRLEGLIEALPAEGEADNLLPVLATLQGSIVGDWLSMLDWADDLHNHVELLGQDIVVRTRAALEAVSRIGAPFQSAIAEGEDQAWNTNLTGEAWDELGEAIGLAVRAGAPEPLERVSLTAATALLSQRLQQGWALIFVSFNKVATVWVLERGRYRRASIAIDQVFNWRSARDRHAKGTSSGKVFRAEVNQFTRQFATTLRPLLDTLSSDCPGIIHFQDFSDLLPMMAVVLEVDDLRQRMIAGQFELRTAPVLYAGRGQSGGGWHKIVACVQTDDGLSLAPEEADALARSLVDAKITRLQADDEAGVLSAMRRADLLLVSTHGQAIHNYLDPAFASLGGSNRPHAINIAAIQRDYPKLPYRLVLLNACHAGAATMRLSDKGFRTHDAASYPAVLLANRMAVIAAAGWAVYDALGFLYAGIVGEALERGATPSVALNSATARLSQMRREEVTCRLLTAPPSAGRDGALRNFGAGSSDDQIFTHPYVCGGWAIYSLL